MNTSLFRSPFAWIALALLLAAVAWAALAARGAVGGAGDGAGAFLVPGAAGGTARVASGIAALVAMLLALAYVLRKYMHKYGYSPEFRMKVEIARLERAERRLNDLRREILRGQHATRAVVERLVREILRAEGVHRVLAARVEDGAAGGPRFVIRVEKAFLLGKAARWLHLHLYVSLVFAAAVFVHGGDGWASPLGAALLATSAVVVVTGIVGIFLWALGPRWLTARERDLSIEESYVLRESFRRKRGELFAALDPDLRAVVAGAGDAQGGERARVLLSALPPDDARRASLHDALVLGGQLARVESEFRVLWRTRLAFMAWRAVHLPAAVLLVFLVVLHLASIAIY